MSNEHKLCLFRNDLKNANYVASRDVALVRAGGVWLYNTNNAWRMCPGTFEALFPALMMRPGEGYELKISPVAADGGVYFQSVRLGDPISKPERTYRIGQRFKIGGEEYLLCAFSPTKYAFVGLKDGVLWDTAFSGPLTHNNLHEAINSETRLAGWSLIEEEE